jgi:hypothetical protein
VSVLKIDKALELLRVNTEQVKVLTQDRRRHYLVRAERALAIVKNGTCQAVGSQRKVRYLLEIQEEHRRFPVDTSWWQDRAVIKFHHDQRSAGKGHATRTVKGGLPGSIGRRPTAY